MTGSVDASERCRESVAVAREVQQRPRPNGRPLVAQEVPMTHISLRRPVRPASTWTVRELLLEIAYRLHATTVVKHLPPTEGRKAARKNSSRGNAAERRSNLSL